MAICPSCENEVEGAGRFCPLCGANIEAVAQAGGDPYVGKLVAGKYLVDRLLGEGGMGKVYKAVQQPLDKAVVLKVLRQALQGDASLVGRFQREARAASRLNHPNSIAVTDFGQIEDGALFIAMEYLEGRDLADELAAVGPLPEARIIHIVTQVLSALADAHAANVIHRDLKPENIMLVPRRDDPDYVKVLDFGIAKIQDPAGTDAVALTQQGLVCGTPEYMSPEQARGETLDARSDLYSVGVVLYQLATGRLPFTAETSVGIVTKHLVEPPPPPRTVRPEVSPAMEALILRCMAKARDDRPATAEALAAELAAVGKGIAPVPRTGTAVFSSGAPVAASPAAHPAPTPADPDVAPVTPAAAADDALDDGGAGRSGRLVWGVGIVAVAAAFGIAYVAVSGMGRHHHPAGAATASTTKPTAATPTKTVPAKTIAAPAGGSATPSLTPTKAATAATKVHPADDHVAHAGNAHGGKSHAGSAHATATSRDPARARRFAAKGDAAWAAQDFDEAIAAYTEATRADPTNAPLERKLGLAYLTLGKNALAKRHLERYLKIAPPGRQRKMVEKLLAQQVH